MNASDVMVRKVVTIGPDDDVAAAVRLLVDHDISALPVVDADNHVLGVLSEGDLLHREEDGTWRTQAMVGRGDDAIEHARSWITPNRMGAGWRK